MSGGRATLETILYSTKKIMHVDNVVFYQRAKYQLDICFIMGCAKMTKSETGMKYNCIVFSIRLLFLLNWLTHANSIWYHSQ